MCIWWLQMVSQHYATYRAARGSAGFDFVAGSDAFYYIKVAHLQGNTPYALELRVGPGQPCEDDLLEPNNEREEPQPLQAGTQNNLSLCQFDVDYYSVSLAAGEALRYCTLSMLSRAIWIFD